jgi:hypothetical protein
MVILGKETLELECKAQTLVDNLLDKVVAQRNKVGFK